MENGLQIKPPFKLPVFWIHVVGWLLFIAYEMGYLFVQGIVNLKFVVGTIPYYVLNISFFYINYQVLDYAVKKGGKVYLRAGILVILELLLLLIAKYGVDYLMLPAVRFNKILAKTNAAEYIVVNLWRCAYFGVISFIYWSAKRMFRYRDTISKADKQTIALLQEKAQLEKNLTESRFAFHQQQINPHFLFNTLNFIYNSVYKHSREASNAVILLSEIMRYSLDDMDAEGKASIEREVEQIENLIEINKLRFDSNLHVDFKIDGDYESVRFIPLILLTFAENVFKYGQLKDEKNPAKMRLAVTADGKLVFETWNAKKQGRQLKDSTGIGVSNAIKRLEYTYGERFDLQIDDQKEAYALKLIVNP